MNQIAPLSTATGAPLPMRSAQATGALVVAPQNFSEVLMFADKMAASRFVPGHLRGKPADCLAVCMQAVRWEMDPFLVAQETYFTKEGAPPGYGAKLINAVVYSRAPLEGRLDIEWTGTWPNRVITVRGKMRGDPKAKERTVHAVNIKTRNSPLWQTDPDQQLAYYATRAWARLYAPDVIMGVYTPDEIHRSEHIGPDDARDITPDAPPASRMEALEEVLEAEERGETETVSDLVDELPPIAEEDQSQDSADETGEPLPVGSVDTVAEHRRIINYIAAETRGPSLRSFWDLDPGVVTLRDDAPDLYADALTQMKARLKAVEKRR